jgi:tetratricopeptide (TPR) repeat protein/tRNA A-37 threonylcarbamoyl transferase component Bud32
VKHLDDSDLLDYIQGRLPPDALARVTAHAESCTACNQQVAEVATVCFQSTHAWRDAERSAALERGPVGQTAALERGPAGQTAALERGPAGQTAPLIVPLPGGDGERLVPGARVDRYIVGSVLGTGGMGVVYAARDPDLGRPVALKLLRTKSAHTTGALQQRLLREAQAMARLSHPNVVSIYDVGLSGNQIFIAMEMIEGGTLRAWLKDKNPDWRAILAAYRQAGEALMAAHAMGIVHRDFKPDNVLIDGNQRVRVADFGLARSSGGSDEADAEVDAATQSPAIAAFDSDGKLTRTGAFIGTPAYMAPEQYLGTRAEAAADQFSFCTSLYEALWKQLPFAGKTILELGRSVVTGEVRRPPRKGPPLWIYRVLARGLHPDPSKRHGSMAELLAALDRDPARARRRWIAGAALLSVVAAVGLVALRQSRANLCGGAAQKLAGIWDAPQREQAHAAFRKSKKPFAEDTFATVTGALDRYVASWSSMFGDACAATRVRGEQSEEVMELRMECLDRRREEVRAVADLLVHADDKMVLHGADAALNLTSLDECRNADALRQVIRPPRDVAARTRVDALREELAKAKARINAGQYPEGRTLAETVVGEALPLGYAPLLGEALYWRGAAELRMGDVKPAATTLLAAANSADAGRDDHVRLTALTSLVYAQGERLRRYTEADTSAALARAALARWGRDDSMESELDDYEALLRRHQGRLKEALELAQHGLELRQKLPHGNEQLIAVSLLNLGEIYREMGNNAQALENAKQALAIDVKRLGALHPDTLKAQQNLGVGLYLAGDLPGAAAAVEKAAAGREALFGPDSQLVAQSLNSLGYVQLRMKQLGRAQPTLEKALAIQLRKDPDAGPVSDTEASLVELYLALGQPDTALPHAQHALAIRQHDGMDTPDLAEALMLLGRVQLAQHQERAAQATLMRALAILEKRAAVVDPEWLPRTRLALADAVVASDRPRARALADQARAFAPLRAEADAWLAAHR